jgi:U3 small nucleolar RNA-associated protein MPP10
MAGGSFSTNSNTSHTLSADPPPHLLTLDQNPPSWATLLSTLEASPEAFLQPTQDLHTAALVLTKTFLDPVAASVNEAHVQRHRLHSRKRRRRNNEVDNSQDLLGLSKLYINGFSTDQVWEQARRVLQATVDEVELDISLALAENEAPPVNGTSKKVSFEDDAASDLSNEESPFNEEELSSEGQDEGDEDEEMGDGEDDFEEEEDLAFGSEDEINHTSAYDLGGTGEFVEDTNRLNDGFFSIDDFNRQTENMERLDAAGEDDLPSDEDEVDWDADPAMSSSKPSSATTRQNADIDSSDDEGPTFGNADLYGVDEDMDEDGDDDDEELGDGDNTNDIFYNDFFAPPPPKLSKKASDRLRDYNASVVADGATAEHDEEDFNGVKRTMDSVRRDLFEDHLSDHDDEDLSDRDPGDPKSRRSAHERRQAKIAEEIRRLEAANVAKREWTLSGEAKARDRPFNSLLEEDLEFERIGKPVPVITTEVTEELEAMIKRRIIAREFDELIRRRPDGLGTESVRRGRIELDHNKSQKSLADTYEEDYLKEVDPANNPDKVSDATLKQRKEIETLWAEIRGELDSLTSWSYRPSIPTANVNVISDVSTITMEDAQPSTAGEIGGASMLAPQEVYKPGSDEQGNKKEVTLKSGAVVNKDELSRDEKKRRRRREKERGRKRLDGTKSNETSSGAPEKGRNKKREERDGIVKDLKRGGVKVIGKKGELRDVMGAIVKSKAGPSGAANFKL